MAWYRLRDEIGIAVMGLKGRNFDLYEVTSLLEAIRKEPRSALHSLYAAPPSELREAQEDCEPYMREPYRSYYAIREALAELESVLCDPEGKACIRGSDGDLDMVDAALNKLRAILRSTDHG